MNSRKTNFYAFYSWKFLDCDICKKPFPEYFEANGRKYDLLSYEKPEDAPFMAIDLFHKETNTIRGCFVIKKTKPVLKVGRGQDCELKLNDISISRNHAILHFSNGYFFLSDLKSKFGTLMLMDESYQPHGQKVAKYQIGMTLLELKIVNEEKKCLCGGSSGPKVKKNQFVTLQNQAITETHEQNGTEVKPEQNNMAVPTVHQASNPVTNTALVSQVENSVNQRQPRRQDFPTSGGQAPRQERPATAPTDPNPIRRETTSLALQSIQQISYSSRNLNQNAAQGNNPLAPQDVAVGVEAQEEEDSLDDLFSDIDLENNQNRQANPRPGPANQNLNSQRLQDRNPANLPQLANPAPNNIAQNRPNLPDLSNSAQGQRQQHSQAVLSNRGPAPNQQQPAAQTNNRNLPPQEEEEFEFSD